MATIIQGAKLFGIASKSKSLIVFINGSYTNLHGKNSTEINEVGILNVSTNEFSMLGAPYDGYVIDLLKKSGILVK